MEPWARYWNFWVNVVFLKAYLDRVGDAAFLPRERQELERLLEVFLLEKAVYELRHDLLNRPDWMPVALYGVRQLAESET